MALFLGPSSAHAVPRSCIFIDGENFRHSLIDLFDKAFDSRDHLPKKGRWQEFFTYLAGKAYESARMRTYWYVVGAVDYVPYKLPSEKDEEKLVKVLSKHPPFRERLALVKGRKRVIQDLSKRLKSERSAMAQRFDGWRRIHDAIALRTDSLEFRRAGAIRYDLFTGRFGTEKAVDVKLAIDLLELRPLYDVAIIVSGDGDYVPAVQALKDSGKRVVNVSFKTRNGRLLPGGAYRLNLVTDSVVEVPYDLMSYLMGFQKDLPEAYQPKAPSGVAISGT